MDRRFHLPFEIMTNDALESARTGNWFLENPLAICRLDKLSRNEDVQAKLQQSDWDPNRLEQRFGRIHRIGQTEVCHLWNLVAKDTREGDVYFRLLEKIEEERKALGGQVFDVLGPLRFEDRSLRELLLEAIRYGDRPEVKERLFQIVDRG